MQTSAGTESNCQLGLPHSPAKRDRGRPDSPVGGERAPLRSLTNHESLGRSPNAAVAPHSCSASPLRQQRSGIQPGTVGGRSLGSSTARRSSKPTAAVPNGSEADPSQQRGAAAEDVAIAMEDSDDEAHTPARAVGWKRISQSLDAQWNSEADWQPEPDAASAASAGAQKSSAQLDCQAAQSPQEPPPSPAAADARIRQLEARLAQQQEDFRSMLAEEVDIRVALQTCAPS